MIFWISSFLALCAAACSIWAANLDSWVLMLVAIHDFVISALIALETRGEWRLK